MSLLKSPNINILWANLLVEELLRQGIDYFCLAPGSRSAPLAVAVGENPRAKSFIHFDERGLAFHALGYAAATRTPCVLISTSGTAGANFLPAVIEASKKKLPLIVLTADRPPELRHTGANQTIDQVGLFKNYVRFEFDFPCPTQDIPPEFVLTTVDQAMHRAKGNPPGPVHMNCMFREPLAPIKTHENFSNYCASLSGWMKKDVPFTRYISHARQLSTSSLKDAASQLKNIRQGLIVIGKLATLSEQQAALNLSRKINWPIFPDITSGLRLGNTDKNVIHSFDQLLLSDNFTRKWVKKYYVDGILHLGGRISSQRWYRFIEEISPEHYVMVLNHPLRNDPLHNVSLRIESEIESFCVQIAPLINQRKSTGLSDELQEASKLIHKQLAQHLSPKETLTEPSVARIISDLIPADSTLFLSSSLPIREIDMYASNDKNKVLVGANRGASGIDGTIATAAGFAKGLNRICTLLIGDLAFLHDLNSLAMLTSAKNPFVVIVLNNNGGGIFSFLPIAKFGHTFEKYFGTPHDLSFANSAELFKLNYFAPQNQKDFVSAYKKALKAKKATILEIKTDRAENWQFQQNLQSEVKTVLDKFGKN